MKNGNIVLRILNNNERDYKLLEKWYQIKNIYSAFEQRKLNYEEIVKKYKPRTYENTKVPVYMIEYNNNPVGIIQYTCVDDENKKLYELSDNNIYEIDIFIGEIDLHNLGIGSKSIKLLTDYLFKEKKAETIVMCPLSNNYKAINCYKKSGFREIKTFKTEDTIGELKEYVLMETKKATN